MILEDFGSFGWLRLTLVNSGQLWSNRLNWSNQSFRDLLGGSGGWRFRSIFLKNTFKTFSNDKEWFSGFWASFGGFGALRGILVIFINLLSSWKLTNIIENLIFLIIEVWFACDLLSFLTVKMGCLQFAPLWQEFVRQHMSQASAKA